MALHGKIKSPSLKRLKWITIKKLPRNTGQIILPIIEILNGSNYEKIWTNAKK